MYYADNEHVQKAAMGLLGVLHCTLIFRIFCFSLTFCANFHSGWAALFCSLMAFYNSRDVYDLKVYTAYICSFQREDDYLQCGLCCLYARSGTRTIYRLLRGHVRVLRVLQMVCMDPFRISC